MQTRLSTEERQAEIVDAALRLARTSSPALITTADIATAIGVTQGAVFKHFPTKDAIWLPALRWVRGVLQGYRQLLLGQLTESIDQRQVSPDLDQEAAATSFIGLVQGLVMQAMLTGRPAAMRQQANAIFALYRRGLGEVR